MTKIKAIILDTYMCTRKPYKLKEVEGNSFTYENVNFIIVKEKYFYHLYELHTGLSTSCVGKTIKELKEAFNKVIETEHAKKVLADINSLPSASERVKKQQRFYFLDKEFTKITGKILPMRLGVDVITLSIQESNYSEDISLEQCIETRYGKKAKDILKEMVELGCVD